MIHTVHEALGIDLGNTITDKKLFGGSALEKMPQPDAFRVIKRLIQERFGDKVHIVSKVTPEEEIRAIAWLENYNFFDASGLIESHVEFCLERHDKAPICERLGITHFIDDRPEVLSHMTTVPYRFLFQGDQQEYETYKHALAGVIIVESWGDIEKYFFN